MTRLTKLKAALADLKQKTPEGVPPGSSVTPPS